MGCCFSRSGSAPEPPVDMTRLSSASVPPPYSAALNSPNGHFHSDLSPRPEIPSQARAEPTQPDPLVAAPVSRPPIPERQPSHRSDSAHSGRRPPDFHEVENPETQISEQPALGALQPSERPSIDLRPAQQPNAGPPDHNTAPESADTRDPTPRSAHLPIEPVPSQQPDPSNPLIPTEAEIPAPPGLGPVPHADSAPAEAAAPAEPDKPAFPAAQDEFQAAAPRESTGLSSKPSSAIQFKGDASHGPNGLENDILVAASVSGSKTSRGGEYASHDQPQRRRENGRRAPARDTGAERTSARRDDEIASHSVELSAPQARPATRKAMGNGVGAASTIGTVHEPDQEQEDQTRTPG